MTYKNMQGVDVKPIQESTEDAVRPERTFTDLIMDAVSQATIAYLESQSIVLTEKQCIDLKSHIGSWNPTAKKTPAKSKLLSDADIVHYESATHEGFDDHWSTDPSKCAYFKGLRGKDLWTHCGENTVKDSGVRLCARCAGLIGASKLKVANFDYEAYHKECSMQRIQSAIVKYKQALKNTGGGSSDPVSIHRTRGAGMDKIVTVPFTGDGCKSGCKHCAAHKVVFEIVSGKHIAIGIADSPSSPLKPMTPSVIEVMKNMGVTVKPTPDNTASNRSIFANLIPQSGQQLPRLGVSIVNRPTSSLGAPLNSRSQIPARKVINTVQRVVAPIETEVNSDSDSDSEELQ